MNIFQACLSLLLLMAVIIFVWFTADPAFRDAIIAWLTGEDDH